MSVRVYLDSCISIYYVELRLPWFAMIEQAFSGDGAPELFISDLVRLECFVLPVRNGDERLKERFDRFFARTIKLELPSEVYELATGLRARHNIKTPDAIHLAAAIHHDCDEFWTNDHRLDRASEDITIRVFEPAPRPGDATTPGPV